jgi:tetratricopeptide (TPR) repeat protein
MAEIRRRDRPSLKETMMRFAPPAAALSLVLAVSASITQAEIRTPDPLAVAMAEEGRAQLAMGDTQGAIDYFEAALVLDPAMTVIYLDLAAAARAEGLQGKAIHFYREAREREPDNLAAISGEGEALVEKGALTAARENLTELESRCGEGCTETRQLAAAIAAGPPVMTAEAITPDPALSQN